MDNWKEQWDQWSDAEKESYMDSWREDWELIENPTLEIVWMDNNDHQLTFKSRKTGGTIKVTAHKKDGCGILHGLVMIDLIGICLLYTSPSPRDS